MSPRLSDNKHRKFVPKALISFSSLGIFLGARPLASTSVVSSVVGSCPEMAALHVRETHAFQTFSFAYCLLVLLWIFQWLTYPLNCGEGLFRLIKLLSGILSSLEEVQYSFG